MAIKQLNDLEKEYHEILLTFAKDLKNFLYLETVPESNYVKNLVILVPKSNPKISFESKILNVETDFTIEYEILENTLLIKDFGNSIEIGDYYLVVFKTIEFQSTNLYEIFGKNLINYFSFDSELYKNTLLAVLNLLLRGPVKEYFNKIFNVNTDDYISKNNWWAGKIIPFKKKSNSIKLFSDNITLNENYLIPSFEQTKLLNSNICISHDKKTFSNSFYFGGRRFNPIQYYYGGSSYGCKFMAEIGKHHLFNISFKNDYTLLNNKALLKAFLESVNQIKTIDSKYLIDATATIDDRTTQKFDDIKKIQINLLKKDLYEKKFIYSNDKKYFFGSNTKYFETLKTKNITTTIKQIILNYYNGKLFFNHPSANIFGKKEYSINLTNNNVLFSFFNMKDFYFGIENKFFGIQILSETNFLPTFNFGEKNIGLDAIKLKRQLNLKDKIFVLTAYDYGKTIKVFPFKSEYNLNLIDFKNLKLFIKRNNTSKIIETTLTKRGRKEINLNVNCKKNYSLNIQINLPPIMSNLSLITSENLLKIGKKTISDQISYQEFKLTTKGISSISDQISYLDEINIAVQ